jgi:hypothetical protein
MMWFAMLVMGVTADAYGSVPVWVILTRPSYHTINETGKESPIGEYPKQEDVRKKVMTWMENATGVKVSDGN